MGEDDRGLCILRFVVPECRGQVEIGEHIAADDQDALIHPLGGIADASRRAVVGVRPDVLHLDAHRRAITEIAGDRLGRVEEGGDDVVQPVLLQQGDDVGHHGFIHEWHHGLGRVAGERAQPRPEPTSHYDGFHSEVRR